MVNTGRSSSLYCMCWLKELFWLSFWYNFHIVATRVSSEDNIIPDFLSKLQQDVIPDVPSSYLDPLCCFQDGRTFA